MAKSGPGLFNFDLKVSGKVLDEASASAVVRIELRQPLHDHHECIVEFESLREAKPPKGLEKALGVDFEISMSSGTSGERKDQLEFKGKITAIQPVFRDGAHGLIVRAQSPTVQLDDTPRNEIFLETKASEWFQGRIGERGLSAEVDTTKYIFPELVQRGETDWEFARRLFAQEGITLFYDGAKIKAKGGLNKVASSMTLSPDSYPFLKAFHCEASLRPLKSEVRSWAAEDDKTLVESTQALKGASGGKFFDDAKKASQDTFSVTGTVLPEVAPGDMSLLTSDVENLGLSMASGLVQARGETDGMELRPGQAIEVKGLTEDGGDGQYLVTSVTHRVDGDGGYRNEFTACEKGAYGPPRWPHSARDGEIWLARVVDVVDPEKQGRIRVSFLNYPEGQSCWARLASVYAGKGGGLFFLPEIDDEVIVTFTEGDHRYPVVLGSVFAPKSDSPALSDVDENHKSGEPHDKLIRTAAGHRIWFRERAGDAVTIELLTPKDECKIVLTEDGAKSTIEIETQGDIKLTSVGECQVKAEKDVSITTPAAANITTEGDVNVKADGKATISASGDALVEGTNIELKSAGGSIKLSASGVDVKGAMIKLN